MDLASARHQQDFCDYARPMKERESSVGQPSLILDLFLDSMAVPSCCMLAESDCSQVQDRQSYSSRVHSRDQCPTLMLSFQDSSGPKIGKKKQEITGLTSLCLLLNSFSLPFRSLLVLHFLSFSFIFNIRQDQNRDLLCIF